YSDVLRLGEVPQQLLLARLPVRKDGGYADVTGFQEVLYFVVDSPGSLRTIAGPSSRLALNSAVVVERASDSTGQLAYLLVYLLGLEVQDPHAPEVRVLTLRECPAELVVRIGLRILELR